MVRYCLLRVHDVCSVVGDQIQLVSICRSQCGHHGLHFLFSGHARQSELNDSVTKNIQALSGTLQTILEIAENGSKISLDNMEMLYILTGRANLQDEAPAVPQQEPAIRISTEKLKDFAALHQQNELQMKNAIQALVQMNLS